MRKILLFVSALFSYLSFLPTAFAHCPLCGAATGALVAGARVAGVDDSIVGLFVGAFTVSMAFWISNFIAKKVKKSIPLQAYIISVAFLAMTVASFYWMGLLGTMPDFLKIAGMERLLFGIVVGSIVSVAAFEFHKIIRRFHGDKNHFPLQGIALPIAALLIAAVGMYASGVV